MDAGIRDFEGDALLGSATVVGTGLVGTSVGLALSQYGVRVHLLDQRAQQVQLAEALGAGSSRPSHDATDIAVIAVPPGSVGSVLVEAQRRRLAKHYTDVASVKAELIAPSDDESADMSRYVGGHPIAGREYSGPGAARADLFLDKPWILTPTEDTSPATARMARALVTMCGARPVMMNAACHDSAIAMTSHLPHLVSCLVARMLTRHDEGALDLCGSGLRDFTRIAAGDPDLWTDILSSNASALLDALGQLQGDLETARRALLSQTGRQTHEHRASLHRLLCEGNSGVALIPQKYGTQGRTYEKVRAPLADREGELARLLAQVSTLNVNVEDLWIEESPTSSTGCAVLVVDAGVAGTLRAFLGTLRPTEVRAPTADLTSR